MGDRSKGTAASSGARLSPERRRRIDRAEASRYVASVPPARSRHEEPHDPVSSRPRLVDARVIGFVRDGCRATGEGGRRHSRHRLPGHPGRRPLPRTRGPAGAVDDGLGHGAVDLDARPARSSSRPCAVACAHRCTRRRSVAGHRRAQGDAARTGVLSAAHARQELHEALHAQALRRAGEAPARSGSLEAADRHRACDQQRHGRARRSPRRGGDLEGRCRTR